ncbi:MAG: EAL domain-containing protein [Psychromonas sp.]|nr:EAL domain-containing protein [Psychromonas sp.]
MVEVFSPYQLASDPLYYKNEDLYFVQAQLNPDFLIKDLHQLVDEYQGYLQYDFIDKNIISDAMIITTSPFRYDIDGFYKGGLETSLSKIVIKLDKNYFREQLHYFLFNLLALNLILIVSAYLMLSRIIDKQIIIPITSLAQSIKDIDVSSVIELKALDSNDEVADLNNSYSSLIDRINILANNDPLTGLANRGNFNKQLASLANSAKKVTTYTALFFIDLDNFKYVNDNFGHDTGDRLLVVFSQRLKHTLRSDELCIDSIARLGGDEFVILLKELPSLEAVNSIGQRICNLFKDGFSVDGNKFDVHASIGISYSNSNFSDGEKLLNQADNAMYLAKREGKNRFKLFSAELEEKMRKEKMIERALYLAQDRDELLLQFMPVYAASSLELRGYEVLLRCPALTKLHIGPDVFIPIAEKTDLILTIDLWVIEHALMYLNKLIRKNDFKGFFSINISSKSLRNTKFYPHFKKMLKKHEIPALQVELEVTETCLLPDDDKAIASFNQLKSLGIRLALDDFGTGYTSFSQLVNYPVDTLKIDRSFVANLHATPAGKKPTLDIIFELACAYQLEVIVEGIETETDFEYIKQLGCDLVQGYYLSKPRPWAEVINDGCYLQKFA